MTCVKPVPCATCPYRKDAPRGFWAAHEYAKLPPYDRPTWEQPTETFMCHSDPEEFCHGWAVVHMSRGHEYELLALRFQWPDNDIPEPVVPLFASGEEAARNGLRAMKRPSANTRILQRRMKAAYPRLRYKDEPDTP